MQNNESSNHHHLFYDKDKKLIGWRVNNIVFDINLKPIAKVRGNVLKSCDDHFLIGIINNDLVLDTQGVTKFLIKSVPKKTWKDFQHLFTQ
ncbi:hypothetical protein BMS_0755A [Halobacteriovorax marinus SJ]|uniref:Uncharacterized protein n=1 Tax=Halobacteriovorax marinus (strain ATCC BAA-682 / DSM 15412 / SJ) TaxID=862908 RepID=E1X5U2_HALMS|nr:hypothetical protein BMS_0755A [Halobacteriovorax marinus SJ]